MVKRRTNEERGIGDEVQNIERTVKKKRRRGEEEEKKRVMVEPTVVGTDCS